MIKYRKIRPTDISLIDILSVQDIDASRKPISKAPIRYRRRYIDDIFDMSTHLYCTRYGNSVHLSHSVLKPIIISSTSSNSFLHHKSLQYLCWTRTY